MEHQISCFEWQNRSSDYLDGTLPHHLKEEANDHLKSCHACAERNKHIRIVLSAIAGLPKATLPAPLKRAPLSAALPRVENVSFRLTRWQRLPWYLRTTLEGLGIVVVVLMGISSAPKIREVYEKSIERRLSDFKESLNSPAGSLEDEVDTNIPPLQASNSLQANSTASREDLGEGDDGDESGSAGKAGRAENSGDQDDSNGGENTDDPVRVGKSQLWRFTLKTVSPDEMRKQVIKALTVDLHIPMNTPGIGGVQVPGGIEFDLLLPKENVPGIKQTLEKLAPHLPENVNPMPGTETFSWYMVKSKQEIPEGKSQVVIWLTQPPN